MLNQILQESVSETIIGGCLCIKSRSIITIMIPAWVHAANAPSEGKSQSPFGAKNSARGTSQKNENEKMRQSAGLKPFGVAFCGNQRVWQSAAAPPKNETGLNLFHFSLPHPRA